MDKKLGSVPIKKTKRLRPILEKKKQFSLLNLPINLEIIFKLAKG